MEIKTKIPSGVVHEVKTYRYVAAGKTMAEIEILVFGGNEYAAQAKIFETGENFSTGKFYKTLQQAIEDIVSGVETKISDSQWVKKIMWLSAQKS